MIKCRRRIERIQIDNKIINALSLQEERTKIKSDFMKILNFPIMSEIFRFYGYLDEWWVLMTTLWSDSYNVWNKNIDAFGFWGRKYIRYSRIWDLSSLSLCNDVSSLFWRQSNYIKRLVSIDHFNLNHIDWIIQAICNLQSGMTLYFISDINTSNIYYHVWVIKKNSFEES